MKAHTRIYMKHFNYGETDFIPCEACGSRSVDVHHIWGRGKGKDVIENLAALCRRHHEFAHNGTVTKAEMQTIHNYFLAGQRKVFLK
jgi:hypothetical protein